MNSLWSSSSSAFIKYAEDKNSSHVDVLAVTPGRLDEPASLLFY